MDGHDGDGFGFGSPGTPGTPGRTPSDPDTQTPRALVDWNPGLDGLEPPSPEDRLEGLASAFPPRCTRTYRTGLHARPGSLVQ